MLMKLDAFILKAHKRIEANEARTIPKKEMAKRIGVSHRAYTEYQRGKNAPLAMKAILNLLAQLKEEEMVRLIVEWKEQKE